MLTLEQRIYLVKCYGIGEISYKYAIELFNRKYPEVYVSVNCVRELILKFDNTGDVKDIKKQKRIHDENDAATLLAIDSVRNEPKKSLRKRSLDLNVSKCHLQRILKNNKIHPYKPVRLHKLEEGDDAFRLEFCMLMGEQIMLDRFFYRRILFSDEATFTTNGVVSYQNCRHWSEENPNFRIINKSQRYKKVNVWCAIRYKKIIGPYFFDATVNQNTYIEMLENYLMPALDDINLQDRRNLYFQHDGCPAHSAISVRNWLDQHFHNKWIGQFGPIRWPARSPDITPLDFFLWGYLKQKVYAHDLKDNLNLLKEKISEAIADINEDTIHSVYEKFRKNIEKCVTVGGQHIE